MRIFKNCFQTVTGYGCAYPQPFYQYFEDSEIWKKLHIAQSFIYYLQKHLFSLLCHDSESVYGVISVPLYNPIPSLNLLIGHAKFVSMNLFLMWQDRALSIYINDVVCCVPGLTLASVGLL